MTQYKPMLVFLRHGQTEWNKTSRLMSRTDMGLSTEGRSLCTEVANASADIPITRIVTSPMERAIETAEIFSRALKTRPPIDVDPDFGELDFGVFEGFTGSAIERSDLQTHYRNWRAGIEVPASTETESWISGAKRAERVFSRYQDVSGITLLVGHGYMIRLLLTHCVLHSPVENLRRIRLDNARFATVEREQDLYRITSLNVRTLVGVQDHAPTS